MDRCRENVIEWIEGNKTATCTFSQRRFINRIKKMAEKHGSPVEILAENMDGSIMAHIPLSAVHLYVSSWNGNGFADDLEEGGEVEESDQ